MKFSAGCLLVSRKSHKVIEKAKIRVFWSLTLDGSTLKSKINKIAEITQLQSTTFWQVWLFC